MRLDDITLYYKLIYGDIPRMYFFKRNKFDIVCIGFKHEIISKLNQVAILCLAL